jgi:cell division septum initiation protein DivIVA
MDTSGRLTMRELNLVCGDRLETVRRDLGAVASSVAALTQSLNAVETAVQQVQQEQQQQQRQLGALKNLLIGAKRDLDTLKAMVIPLDDSSSSSSQECIVTPPKRARAENATGGAAAGEPLAQD